MSAINKGKGIFQGSGAANAREMIPVIFLSNKAKPTSKKGNEKDPYQDGFRVKRVGSVTKYFFFSVFMHVSKKLFPLVGFILTGFLFSSFYC